MNSENIIADQNIDVLGIGYVYSYLGREGYIVFEVNTDPNHHFQLLAKKEDDVILVAVRTAYHPTFGTIDKAIQEKLIEESERFNAIPHFASLAVTPVETVDLAIDGLTGGKEYKVAFNGITIV